MKKTFFALVAAMALLTAFQPTQVEAQEGFYVGAFGGGNFIQTRKKHEFDLKFRSGYAVGGSVGYKWCQGYRLEVEGNYRHNRLKSVEVADVSGSLHGHLCQWGVMANAFYDMDLGCWDMCNTWDIVPYVGVGIGYQEQKLKMRDGGSSSSSFSDRNKDDGFGWQVIAGLAYEIMPCVDLAIEYRFNQGRADRLYNHVADAAVRYHF